MTKISLAVLAVVLGASAASAQVRFESQVSDASQDAAAGLRAVRAAAAKQAKPSFAAQGAPTQYAKTIVCANTPKESGLGDLKFYTRLDGKPVTQVHADDTAYKLDDYHSSYIKDGKWEYNAWSCDTQDYYFSFDAESLLKTTAGEKSRAVKGHARVETRGRVDWEGDLDCTASF